MSTTIARTRTIGDMSSDTRILYALITKRFVEDKATELTYDELSTAIGGMDVRARAKGNLTSARRAVERDHHIIIEVNPAVGLTLSDALSGVLTTAIDRIGRASRRASSRVINACVDRTLSNEDKVNLGAKLSLLGAIRQFTRPKAEKLIEGKVRENQAKELPTADTIRLFIGEKN
jgi:hypothetical protein